MSFFIIIFMSNLVIIYIGAGGEHYTNTMNDIVYLNEAYFGIYKKKNNIPKKTAVFD